MFLWCREPRAASFLPPGGHAWVCIPVPPPLCSSVYSMLIGVSHLFYYVLNTFLPNVAHFLQGGERIYAVLVPYFYQGSANNFRLRVLGIFSLRYLAI